MSDSVSSDNRGPTENAPGPSRAVVNGMCDGSLSLLDRLSTTRGVWELLSTHPQQATELLAGQPSGTFIITQDAAGGSRVISIRTWEGGADAVRCFSVLEENTAVYLEGSHLRFRDLLDLVSFHMVSRDILPDLLRVPNAFQRSCKSELDALAALGMKFWTMPLKLGAGLASAEEGAQGSNGEPHESGRPDGSIQVTSEEGALCIINPLFLSVHGDACWLNSAPNLCRANSRRGTLRLRNGRDSPADSGSTAVSSKQEDPECLDRPGSPEEEKAREKGGSVPPSSSVRRKPFLRSLAKADSTNISEELPASPGLLQKEVKSPHRVSWIEAASATVPPCCPPKESGSESSLLNESLVLPPIPELDSLSLSSMEDEGDSLQLTASHKKRRSSSSVLTYKVLHRLSAVGSTLGGLLSTERRLSNRVQELAQEPMSYLGGLVQSFVGHILRGSGMRHPTSTDMLQEIRQMISNLKGYLCESSELRTICEHGEMEEIDLGSVVEAALYKCVLKPLRDSVYAQLLDFRTRDGSLARLREHQATMNQQSLAELGVTAGVPDEAGLERIRNKLSRMHQAYSPKKKETQMLKACKLIYEAMNQTAGRTEPFGADDFLPVLTYVLLNCDIVSVQLDVEYMMELMDPGQLQGEGGYYLTTWFGVLYHITNFQPATMVTRQISIEAQRSIHQWHRRRTIHHHHGYRGHSQFIISESERGEPPCLVECPRERGRPICASDGKLYKSPCTFQRARCREPFLEALPRSHCGGGSHREPNNANLTRCQEDRATALSQSRRQAHATYVPECSEDGSFLQVQCHKQTGYCWCSTPEGKPISGTSVLNETPNCTGSYTVRTSWQDPNSSRREEGSRPRPTQPIPLPHKQEEGTSLPFLIPVIIPDFKPNRTAKQIQDYPPSCEQERREAIEEAQQHQQEGTFIPECEGDGTYKMVQCHQATGYCWCVRVDTGRPVPGTSTRNFPPDCGAEATAKSVEMGSLFRDRTLPGCPGAKKAEFISNLIKALASDMLQSRMMPAPYRRFPDRLTGRSLEERVVRWQFVRLDKDFSNGISERELRPLKLYMKKHTRPKRCVRKFLDYCDLDEDRLISLNELRGCLGLS